MDYFIEMHVGSLKAQRMDAYWKRLFESETVAFLVFLLTWKMLSIHFSHSCYF